MTKTPWFSSDRKPVRKGVYQTRFRGADRIHAGYSLWDGRKWLNQYSTPDEAAKNNFAGRQDKRWRGLAEPAA